MLCCVQSCEHSVNEQKKRYINSNAVKHFISTWPKWAHVFHKDIGAVGDLICNKHYHYAESHKTKKKRRSKPSPLKRTVFDETGDIHITNCIHLKTTSDCTPCLVKALTDCANKRKTFDQLSYKRKTHYYTQCKELVNYILDNAALRLYVDGYNEKKETLKIMSLRASASMIIVGPRLSQRRYEKSRAIFANQGVEMSSWLVSFFNIC